MSSKLLKGRLVVSLNVIYCPSVFKQFHCSANSGKVNIQVPSNFCIWEVQHASLIHHSPPQVSRICFWMRTFRRGHCKLVLISCVLGSCICTGTDCASARSTSQTLIAKYLVMYNNCVAILSMQWWKRIHVVGADTWVNCPSMHVICSLTWNSYNRIEWQLGTYW